MCVCVCVCVCVCERERESVLVERGTEEDWGLLIKKEVLTRLYRTRNRHHSP